ncbi:MAG: hypothetical protein B7Z55_05290 [Planctomycetales bacterium 12-60-4]|nr:MAG: hypothetical protein B7Z55_05290 [Planctomycetales bacterium 12-60-4]
MGHKFLPGDPVIFCVSKISTEPGPRAEDVYPAAHGDTYSYLVPKFWRVERLNDDGSLVLVTRRGKRHTVIPDDPRLRAASLWERWTYSHRFPPRHLPGEPKSPAGVLQNSVS